MLQLALHETIVYITCLLAVKNAAAGRPWFEIDAYSTCIDSLTNNRRCREAAGADTSAITGLHRPCWLLSYISNLCLHLLTSAPVMTPDCENTSGLVMILFSSQPAHVKLCLQQHQSLLV